MVEKLIEQAREQATWDIPESTQQLLLQLAKELEKRIPRNVKYNNRHGEGYDLFNKDYFHCPDCGRRLRNKQKDPYCGRCGKKLNWSDYE